MKHAPIVVVCLPVLYGCAIESRIDWPHATWESVTTPSKASLRGLAVVDASVVWVGGAEGTLLRTVDGGQNWQNVAPPDSSKSDFRDIEVFDADQALAMVAGLPARIYRTADGGKTWQVVHDDPRPKAFFDAMAFAGDRGYLFGDPIDGVFTLLTSADRGATWTAVAAEVLPHPVGEEAGFAASGTCVAVHADGAAEGQQAADVALWIGTGGSASRCVRSLDGGTTWHATALPLAQGAPAQGAFGLAFKDRSAGVAVGGDYREPQATKGTAAWTADGGRSWRTVPGGAGGFRSAALWLGPDDVLAVGSHGSSLSRDRGRSWRPFGTDGFHSVAMGRDGSVWACGSDGRVARLALPQ
ncbi:MAG TPA: YCF48-related protein [Planctomycetota bacterium]|nr:YCF48-related protein [Planctomycetota bacterium]